MLIDVTSYHVASYMQSYEVSAGAGRRLTVTLPLRMVQASSMLLCCFTSSNVMSRRSA